MAACAVACVPLACAEASVPRAWAQVNGEFNYNRTPLAPPGVRVLVHQKPTVRETWAPHAVEGWYLGPALNHYRCYRVWVDETSAERIADTLAWFPTQFPMPTASSADAAVAAARDLIRALQHPSLASPLAPIGDSHHAALQQLAEIFSQVTDATAQMPEEKPTDVPSLDIAPAFASAVAPPRVVFAQGELQAVEPPAAPPIAVVPATGAAPPRVVLAHDAGHPRVNEEGATHPRVDEDGFTYVNHTTNPGRRRRQAKKAAKASKTAPPAPTIIAQRHLPTAKVPAPDAVAQVCPTASILRRSRFATPEVSDPTTAAAPVQTQSLREPPAASPHSTRSRTRNARLREAQQHVATGHSANAAATLLAHQLGDEPDSFRASINAVVDPVTGMELDYNKLKAGPDGPEWVQAMANELGRLTQGVLPHMPTGTDTMRYIRRCDVPTDRTVTYFRIVAAEKPHKAESKRIRGTVGGDCFHQHYQLFATPLKPTG